MTKAEIVKKLLEWVINIDPDLLLKHKTVSSPTVPESTTEYPTTEYALRIGLVSAVKLPPMPDR